MSSPVPPPPPENPGAAWTPAAAGTPQPVMPDLSEFVNNPGKPPKKSNSKTGLYVGLGIGAVVLAGGGFLIGQMTASGPSTLAAAVADAQAGKLPCGTPTTSATPGAGGFGGGGGGRFGGLFGPGTVTGTLTAVSSSSLTLQTRGGNVTVALPSTAKVTKTTAGALSDLAPGQTVAVSTTTSGSAQTATKVFVLPTVTTPTTPGN